MDGTLYTSDFCFHYSNDKANEYFWVRNVSGKKFYYIKDKEYIKFYELGKVSPHIMEIEHLPTLEKHCKSYNMNLIEKKAEKTKLYTVEKFLVDTEIKNVHFRWRSSRALERDKNREILTYLIAPYSGVIIAKQHSGKCEYMAYKYIITDEVRNHATFHRIPLMDALCIIKKYANKKMRGSLTTSIENKIKSSAFMEKL